MPKKSLFQSSKGRSGYEAQRAAESAYRSSVRAAAKTERVAGVKIGFERLSKAELKQMSPQQIISAATNILTEREISEIRAIKGITENTGQKGHNKALMMFDLIGAGPGGKAKARKFRKMLEGQDSDTALKSAADALIVSGELLEMWMSEGNIVDLEGDGKIIF